MPTANLRLLLQHQPLPITASLFTFTCTLVCHHNPFTNEAVLIRKTTAQVVCSNTVVQICLSTLSSKGRSYYSAAKSLREVGQARFDVCTEHLTLVSGYAIHALTPSNSHLWLGGLWADSATMTLVSARMHSKL